VGTNELLALFPAHFLHSKFALGWPDSSLLLSRKSVAIQQVGVARIRKRLRKDILGKDGVGSSILLGSTIFSQQNQRLAVSGASFISA
jgi:hypothetical protein